MSAVDRHSVPTSYDAPPAGARPDPSSRLTTLAAVLLGLVALGTALPFAAADSSPLWSTSPTSAAAAVKAAAIVLLVVLLWCAIEPAWVLQSAAQVVAGVLLVVAVVAGPEVGSGGALLGLVGLLAAGTGLVGVGLTRARR